jgi:amino acid adenylation domain-containing protein
MHKPTLVNHFLENSAERLPGKTCLVHDGRRVTYGELNDLADRLAAGLSALGVRRGDRVAVFMDNSVEAVASLFAALKAGAAFLMINPATKRQKLEYILNDCSAAVLLTQGVRMAVASGLSCPHLRAVVVSGPTQGTDGVIALEALLSGGRRRLPACIDLDLASIMYTSGSTGRPKGVMLSHLNMVSAAHSITTYLENRETDVIMDCLPLSFDYGLYQVLMGFQIGGTVILEKSFTYPYQILDAMVREEVTGFPGVPSIFAILLRMKDIGSVDLHALRYITNTAAVLPKSHIARLRSLFPGVRIYSMYGLTECKRVSYLPPEELDRRPTSIGKGMPNEEVFVVNEQGERTRPGEIGELVVRGTNVMLGYWNLPGETERRLRPGRYPGERVFYTGDLFTTDDEGYLYFVARKDDIIKSGGEKVSPREVENVLYSHDEIVEAAVVAIPDEILGEAVKAFVAVERGSTVTERDVLRYCSERLEPFLVPRQVEIRESLPKSENGKIDKKELKALQDQP